jgi:hypothetical protein
MTTLPKTSIEYESNLARLKSLYHSHCMFNSNPPVADFHMQFDEEGIFSGEFTGDQTHQGYDGMIHGGLIAAMIDSSMVQCLMGHGIIGYTTDLAIKYCKPVQILQPTLLRTEIINSILDCLYSLKCDITQGGQAVVQATGKFYKGHL